LLRLRRGGVHQGKHAFLRGCGLQQLQTLPSLCVLTETHLRLRRRINHNSLRKKLTFYDSRE
jgi:hypothetical protein